MAFVETWDELKPDGATQRGFELDDEVRTAKRALRERNEGDVVLAGWCTAWGTTAKPKEGMARVFFDTEANLGTKPLEDGRIFVSTDTNRLWHLATGGAVELAYADPGKAETWTAKQTFNPGTTPQAAIELDIAALVAAGQRDSHNFLMIGRSFDTGAHNIDWIWFVDVTSNAGASTLGFQSRIDGAAFATKFFCTDAGDFAAVGAVQGTRLISTIATGTAPLTVASTTLVTNLNADFLDGSSSAAFANASHTHNAADIDAGVLAVARIPDLDTVKITTGTFANGRIAVGNVTQHVASIDHDALLNFVSGEHFLQSAITVVGTITTGVWQGTAIASGFIGTHTHAAADVNSGTFANARISAGNVTQHEAALTILESQITNAGLLARNADTETVAGAWTFTSTLIVTGTLTAKDNVSRVSSDNSDVGTGAATVETTLHSVTVPANAMGTSGGIRIVVVAQIAGSAGNKTLRVKFGGVNILVEVYTAGEIGTHVIVMSAFNRASASSQIWGVQSWKNSAIDIIGSATTSVDTTAAAAVTVTGETPNSADEVTANLTTVELIKD